MSRKHSTLLKEEVDDEGSSGSGGEKKKREKEKDGGDKRKKAYKKGDKNEGYFNDSMTKSSKAKTSAIGGAAVNPSAETMTSPVHSQQPGVIPPPLQPPPSGHGQRQTQNQQNYMPATVSNKQGYITVVQGQQIPVHSTHVVSTNWQQQSMPQRIPPPPGAAHAQMAQHPHQQIQTIPHSPQAQYVTQGQHPQQQGQGHPQQQGQVHPQQQVQVYQPHPPQQGYYTVVQYPHGVPNQVPGYSGHAIAHTGMVHGQGMSDAEQTVWHPAAPQSPTNQGQAHDPSWQQHAEGNWSGHPGTVDPSWNPAMAGASPDAHRDGSWAAFDGSPPEKPPQQLNRKEITWKESPDNSSSDEEIERCSSPEMAGEEGEGLLRAPSLTSFAESSSSVEDEHEESPWEIQPEQHVYYMKQFKRLQPNEGGVIKGPKARDFFLKSNLPTEILSKVWHLSDINKDNALDLDEFCIAMHLVVAIRHGLDLPAILPDILLHHRSALNDLSTNTESENARQENEEEDSVSQPIPIKNAKTETSKDIRPRSLSDTSLSEDHHSEMISRKTSVPAAKSSVEQSQGRPISPGHMVSIERPRAIAKFSLLDSLPGQLLPPPSGKFAGWSPSKTDKDSDSAESDDDDDDDDDSERGYDDDEPRPMSPGQTMPMAIPMPSVAEDEAQDDHENKIPTPPSSPQSESPKPVLPDFAQVTRRLSKKSSERPKSAGDVNEIATPGSESSPTSTPTNSSVGSDGKKEPPPPPPPRNKRGHSRSSSLDLNKLFAAKSKETRAGTFGSPTSSQSSHNSQSGEVPLPLKDEPKPEQEEITTTQTTQTTQIVTQTTEETPEPDKKVAKEENFADFSNFEHFVKAQGTSSESQMTVPTQGRVHKRSLSLDQGQDYHWPQTPQPTEGTVNGPSKIQEALPRPVPKLKPPVSPPVKLLKLQTPKKDGNEERKLNTEPPKVVVKPLTKESKIQNTIRELKDKNLLLSRLNRELQQESKEVMEQRISLELKLERLKPFKSNNK